MTGSRNPSASGSVLIAALLEEGIRERVERLAATHPAVETFPPTSGPLAGPACAHEHPLNRQLVDRFDRAVFAHDGCDACVLVAVATALSDPDGLIDRSDSVGLSPLRPQSHLEGATTAAEKLPEGPFKTTLLNALAARR